MAKVKTIGASIYLKKKKKRGKAAKNQESNNKKSKNYKKPYRGQGR